MAEEEGFEPSVLLPEWVGLSRRRGAAERSNGALEAVVPRREPRVRIPLPPSTSLSHREFRRCGQGGLGDAPLRPAMELFIADHRQYRAQPLCCRRWRPGRSGESCRRCSSGRASPGAAGTARPAGSTSSPAACSGRPGARQCMGFTTKGLLLSLLTVGRPFDEATVLRAAYAYQRAQPGAGARSCWSYRAGLLANEDQIAMICVSAPLVTAITQWLRRERDFQDEPANIFQIPLLSAAQRVKVDRQDLAAAFGMLQAATPEGVRKTFFVSLLS
jgi:hypothetical protein